MAGDYCAGGKVALFPNALLKPGKWGVLFYGSWEHFSIHTILSLCLKQMFVAGMLCWRMLRILSKPEFCAEVRYRSSGYLGVIMAILNFLAAPQQSRDYLEKAVVQQE